MSGCSIPDRPYRMAGAGDALLDTYKDDYPGQLPNAAREGADYSLSFIEFDEKGDFWDRRQLAYAGKNIAAHEKPVLLITFIHGWHHNANKRTPAGDVENFEALLGQLAATPSLSAYDVHGVYIGWRGAIRKGWADYPFTFTAGKARATRVASLPVTESIFEVIRRAREKPGSRTVVIGHSFGALVLERAMLQAYTGMIYAQRPDQPVYSPADLVLLVNSASDSLPAKEFSDMLARMKMKDVADVEHPLLVSITSETDSATKNWFPLGTKFTNAQYRRTYHWGNRYGQANDNVRQFKYLTTTPGHNPLLFTHTVKTKEALPAKAVRALDSGKVTPLEANVSGLLQDKDFVVPVVGKATEAAGKTYQGYTLDWNSDVVPLAEWKQNRRLPKEEQRTLAIRTQYWIMQVPDQILHEHGPIFTDTGRAFMAALVRMAIPPGAPKGPRTLQIAPQDLTKVPEMAPLPAETKSP